MHATDYGKGEVVGQALFRSNDIVGIAPYHIPEVTDLFRRVCPAHVVNGHEESIHEIEERNVDTTLCMCLGPRLGIECYYFATGLLASQRVFLPPMVNSA